MRKSDIISGILLTLFGLVSLWVIIPDQISGHSDYGLAPDFFPRALMWMFTVLSACLAGSRLKQVLQNAGATYFDERPPMVWADWMFIAGAAAALCIAYNLMDRFGFLWGGGFVILCAGAAMGNLKGHPIRQVAMTLVAPFVIYYLFRHLFLVFLPL
ncbi:tripartite tricarboxylate transporter TctB family protein [Roseibium limicola]|uniref:Tripartite tricarboxylate transporter TctB family protein n=1 Tax=Roseibium limicola TaxID=2816037 RepID=A0A939ES95_9HYPH|nr:tripartite tricarboxylate transporter TctB family protein [Roseibium limicola]MBO0346668.1 tripartite tricarboxylate transporter TctB family protein [Roseibium limicola]